MWVLGFIVSLFLASLSSHTENESIKRYVEMVPKKGLAKLANILSRYPALIALLLFEGIVLQLSVLFFVTLFILCQVICFGILKQKKIKKSLLKKQFFLDILSVVFVTTLWLTSPFLK